MLYKKKQKQLKKNSKKKIVFNLLKHKLKNNNNKPINKNPLKMHEKLIIIDGKDHILGRLSSTLAKQLLSG